jgi:hypothetical protein
MKLFSNIEIVRNDPYEVELQRIKIPVTYATKSKTYIAEKQENPAYSRSISVLLPRIAVLLSGIDIIHDEKLHELHKLSKYISDDNKKALQTYTPTPIMLNYSVSIWTKYHADAHQIIEQIIPYFHTSHSLVQKILTPIELEYNTPITLNSISPDIDADMDSEAGSVRVIIWNMEFSMKAFLFKPVIDANIIKKSTVTVNGYDEDDADPYSFYFSVMDEIYPSTAEYEDEWQIKETHTDELGTTEKFVERER